MKTVIYPGSFDPPTNGHLDIIQRAARVFDKVIVAVLNNPEKNPMFTVAERRKMLEMITKEYANVEIDDFNGLLVDYVREKQVSIVIKGLRAISDFENEMQMALTNRKLAPDIETIFMMTNHKCSFLSSSVVKEVVAFDGCIEGLVPEQIQDYIIEKRNSQRK
ncbi:pantetheine-phosphate adenylyltransferase [Natranaerobius thermophilus]|uniref:Phosphopantetheine adenylyltransferase n=1 Tax=Natranaerobius thermophilus (strain ATCC BAA-1301 / DSM 18059 / JW/NM-WN-LF) TaxID=457570 RepID=COAD_NATTJ|nr:pantetheine-phosphate adenylyltransferase [Natranaerobius thermophilus]B2A2L7.1 RecName: Full=Phosphopantetheine adenylyltransferase; AltName: Full=Dephospho-CoA pyrophosphorylase; AltName: Full=Pantetheine-phosphate adenylyltransferase; Short=PPAT [Natranaerobius thermophilus JW/NM-WN-LF]ACB84932.1 Phosphopantetheine adenylyltransferase [Natranaerobius thermophilus JW/NM-WN-LF]